MRIGFTTDTHLCDGLTSIDSLQEMAEDLRACSLDLLLHGGDIAETRVDLGLYQQALEILSGPYDAAGVCGNHDLWVGPNSPHTSWDLWTKILPEATVAAGWQWLETSNWVRDDVAVVGCYLHYNYSAADPEGVCIIRKNQTAPDWTMDEYYERMKKSVVNDAKFFSSLPRDKEFAAQMGAEFEKRLQQAEDDPKVHSIVIVTHVPCMPCQITRKPQDWHWSCATAYFGNITHSEFILGLTKVKAILSGHSHQDNDTLVAFHDGHEARVLTLGADYGDPLFEVIVI